MDVICIGTEARAIHHFPPTGARVLRLGPLSGMHELSVVEALIEQVEEQVERSAPGGRVIRLELSIGRLSGVHCDSVRFAFELLAPGTLLEGAEMSVTEPKATAHCHDCNARVEIDELVAGCPRCDSGNVTIEGGRELLLRSIEIED